MKTGFFIGLFFCLMVMSVDASAATPTIDQLFASFETSSVAIMKLAGQISLIIGGFFVASSIFKYIQHANGKGEFKPAIVSFIIGGAMLALSSSMDTISATMMMTSTAPGDFVVSGVSGSGPNYAAAIKGVLVFIQMIGYIAFIRGWLLLNQLGANKEGVLGRGLTHIFGGMAAININQAVAILAKTFNISVPFIT